VCSKILLLIKVGVDESGMKVGDTKLAQTGVPPGTEKKLIGG
jgi:hypothetical protein